MCDQDPFAVFGEDDDEDENEDDTVANESSPSTKTARSLMDIANSRMLQNTSKNQTMASSETAYTNQVNSGGIHSSNSVNLSWDPPLYMGPIGCVHSALYGGGREFVALRDLEPGTLILVEEPVIEWPTEQLGAELGLVSVRHILEHDNARKLIHDLEDFHPTRTAVQEFNPDDLQIKGMIEILEKDLSKGLLLMADLANTKGFTNRDGTALDIRDITRLLLALRYNGFESGVYLHLAIFNHNCYPNVVKFAPVSSYSEVRTTRPVKAGEALTISYVPTIMSHASRRHHLWEQHLFDIGDSVSDQYRNLEIVGERMPESSPFRRDNTSAPSRIEDTCCRLHEHFREMSPMLLVTKGRENPLWEEAKALELASLELYVEAKNQLENDCHLLLIRCLQLHVELCDIIQQGQILKSNQHVLLLLRMLSSCLNLLEIQTLCYGPDHFDLARSYNEVSQTLAELMATAPRQLVAQGLKGLNSVSACAAAEYRARSEFQRIRDLYPTDAKNYIQTTGARR